MRGAKFPYLLDTGVPKTHGMSKAGFYPWPTASIRNLRLIVMFVTLLNIDRFMSRGASEKKIPEELSFIVQFETIILIVWKPFGIIPVCYFCLYREHVTKKRVDFTDLISQLENWDTNEAWGSSFSLDSVPFPNQRKCIILLTWWEVLILTHAMFEAVGNSGSGSASYFYHWTPPFLSILPSKGTRVYSPSPVATGDSIFKEQVQKLL